MTLAVTEDLVTDDNGGFSLQLNAYPMPGVTSVGLTLNWIQFTLYVSNTYGNRQARWPRVDASAGPRRNAMSSVAPPQPCP